jgi:hypothetical protein
LRIYPEGFPEVRDGALVLADLQIGDAAIIPDVFFVSIELNRLGMIFDGALEFFLAVEL